MIKLKIPFSQKDLLALKIGDGVSLEGTIFTVRDRACEFLQKNDFKKLRGSVIYHCGPIIKNNEVVAAGPTTSARLNYCTPKLLDKYGIQGIIGKGGMDDRVLKALKGRAVYFSAIGGAAVLYAETMRIKNIYKKDFGMVEAIWEFEVKNFPAIVAMDSGGNSLYDIIYGESKINFEKLITFVPR